MWVIELLRCARDRKPLPSDALRAFVQGIAMKSVPDYQAASFLMAVFQQGLRDEDTTALTLAMRDSGRCIDLSHVSGLKVDKHSTGGVGDKLSLCLAPWVAACGVPVPMVGGRGLGHTGGTLDKLESIPGFRVDLSIDAFIHNVAQEGVCLMGQTQDLAPADQVLYALRDVTATVESIPLITASILAKKLAEGIDALVLDVKVGSGAFMKDLPAARGLAQSLIRVGHQAGIQVRALITDMAAPLGRTIGNVLEVQEAIAILHGQGPKDSTALTEALAVQMLLLGKVAHTEAEAKNKLAQAIADGSAWRTFRRMVIAQGGDVAMVDQPDRLPRARHRTIVPATHTGFVHALDAYVLGHGAMALGAGRSRAEDTIDPAVGIAIPAQVGEPVKQGDPVLILHHNAPLPDGLLATLQQAITLGPNEPKLGPQVLETLGD